MITEQYRRLCNILCRGGTRSKKNEFLERIPIFEVGERKSSFLLYTLYIFLFFNMNKFKLLIIQFVLFDLFGTLLFTSLNRESERNIIFVLKKYCFFF